MRKRERDLKVSISLELGVLAFTCPTEPNDPNNQCYADYHIPEHDKKRATDYTCYDSCDNYHRKDDSRQHDE